jgi:hypothetical protein
LQQAEFSLWKMVVAVFSICITWNCCVMESMVNSVDHLKTGFLLLSSGDKQKMFTSFRVDDQFKDIQRLKSICS